VKATYCSKISREDGQIFFQKQSAQEIYNTYRAYFPWPGIYSFYKEKRFVLEEVAFHAETAP
jgi:methionyl-tRNA formyltransferase